MLGQSDMAVLDGSCLGDVHQLSRHKHFSADSVHTMWSTLDEGMT